MIIHGVQIIHIITYCYHINSLFGHNPKTLHFEYPVDCKTVGFFLKISKEIGKAWRKSLTLLALT